ncbi:MAG: transcription-repair coupling factor, partial [Chitinophagaceae bacterium]
MSVQDLLFQYQQSSRVSTLAERISFAEAQKIWAKNLRGSSAQFVAGATFLHPSGQNINHVFVCNDPEEAAYFHNTLENLTDALNIFYFPSSFKNNKNYRLLHSSHVMLRTEALTKFAQGTGNRVGALVTYPDALFEKVVVSTTISENIIHIRTGDVLNTDELYEKLVNYGFERTDFVYQPGQFAMRGGILDIYSFGNEKPYRIELFGNDVDSIRIIDPETQLSERRLLQVAIIPNVDLQFDNEEKVSLLEFLPPDTVLWIQDRALTNERLLTCEEDLQLFLQLRAETNKRDDEEDGLEKRSVGEHDFVSASHFFEQADKRHIIYFGHERPEQFDFELPFNTKEQPPFNRQFDLLIKDLKGWESKKFALNLFAENPKQLER